MLNALFENRYTSGLSSSLPGISAKNFAEEVAKKAGETLEVAAKASADAAADATDNTAALEKAGQVEKLRESLTDTLAWAGSRFGDDAAQAMMGIMAASLGDGEITEDSIGNALLEAVRFVDGSFGFEEGDAFMEQLNGSLNDSLNALFDNGAAEQFFAVSSDGSVSGIPGGLGLDLGAILGDMADSILKMIAEMRAGDKNAANGIAYGQLRQNPVGLLLDARI